MTRGNREENAAGSIGWRGARRARGTGTGADRWRRQQRWRLTWAISVSDEADRGEEHEETQHLGARGRSAGCRRLGPITFSLLARSLTVRLRGLGEPTKNRSTGEDDLATLVLKINWRTLPRRPVCGTGKEARRCRVSLFYPSVRLPWRRLRSTGNLRKTLLFELMFLQQYLSHLVR